MENEINKQIGISLRKLRKDKLITKPEILKILNVSSQQLNKYENGTNRISASKLALLLNILNINFNTFCNSVNNNDEIKLLANYNKILNPDTKMGVLELICAIAKLKK